MELFLIALAAGGGGGFLVKKWRARSALRSQEQQELEGVKRLADEDVTLLGEQLQRLGREVEGKELDEATRLDYQSALDAYESAQRTVHAIRTTDEISKITDTLSSGRYAMACVQARVAGRPVPELRVPCFFNPQHGPSVGDVMWNPPGRGTRLVPACSQDAARVAARERPEVRKVKIGQRTVPYWEAGAAYQPYAQGYFQTAMVMTWAFQAPTGFEMGGFGGGEFGGGGGYDGGGFDGGYDGGGGGGE
jgi:hypothetical protein